MTRPVIVPFFVAHQGCPHRCAFCNQWTIGGTSEPFPSSDQIVERVARYLESSHRDSVEVAFYGGTFTSLPLDVQQRLLHPLQPLLKAGTVSRVRISTRPDAVDEDVAEFLWEMGVHVVELGVQSLDDDVLLQSARGHTARDVSAAVDFLRRRRFLIGLQLMTGLPGDTPETSLATLERALRLEPDFLRIYPTLVLAGTELEKRYRSGAYVPMSLEDAVTLCSRMLRLARSAGIPVIRLGLQATDELQSPGKIVAGPYHPAFRQLVQNELCYEELQKLTAGMSGPITVFCAPGCVSNVVGQQRCNVKRLASQEITVVAVTEDKSLPPTELRVERTAVGHRGGAHRQY